MKKFLDENFLLKSKTAQRLYHAFAAGLPIIDYHCHLHPREIASNHSFQNLAEAWLSGDHYKWRMMRANGIDESYCTGNKPDEEKFMKWAETVPYTLRNPLYHWTHLELQRYFDEYDLLNPRSASRIYEECSAKLQSPGYSVRNLLKKMKVQLICTTDDPVDDLNYHKQISDGEFEVKVFPAFRPDQAMAVDNAASFNAYVQRLEQASSLSVTSYQDYLDALKSRHDYFAQMNCVVSDHGLEQMIVEDYTDNEIEMAFNKLRSGKALEYTESQQLKSALLFQFAIWDHEKNWVQQYHLGAIRNNNTRMLQLCGSDAGCDSVGDFQQAKDLSKFLNRLDSNNQLAKTILYNLNPADNELFATMAGNFNDGSCAGKVQYGAAWWFLDQEEGIIRQLNALSNMGLLSRFTGMVTDSRSFLSYPRHEYFRRILCNLIGKDVEEGKLPDDMEWTGKIIGDICYHNAAGYFNWSTLPNTKPLRQTSNEPA